MNEGTTPTSDPVDPTPDSTPTPPAADAAPAAPAAATTDEVTTKLTELGVDTDTVAKIKDELGVTSIEDLAVLAEKDLVGVGVKVVQARKLIGAFAPAPAATADTATLGATAAIDGILPGVPDDASWLEALKTGGVLKVDISTVIATIRAALASRVGLYEVPGLLVQKMEEFADQNEEPIDPSIYFPLRDQLTRRNYGDIFSAIPGLNGNYVTEARKRQLFERIDSSLWPSITLFFDQLKSWQEAWLQGAANPAMILPILLSAGGGAGVAMPPGMIQPPDTGVVRDYAEAVADASNRVFAGAGVQVASALAYEAAQIRKSLEDPRLPAMIGAANRDQMLKSLGVNVSSTYPRLEVNVTRFVLSTLQAKDQPAGNEELQYFSALYMLGSQIPWGDLAGGPGSFSTIGGSNRERTARGLGRTALDASLGDRGL